MKPFFDDNGMLIATRDLENRSSLWEVCESGRFPGRYFFSNKETGESKWALPPSALGLPPREHKQRLELPHIRSTSRSSSTTSIDSPRLDPGIVDGRAPFTVTGGLGHGGFGCVVKARHHGTGKEFAMKVLPKRKEMTRRDKNRLDLELKLMSELPSCPFLIRCHFAFESATDIFFVMDLVTGGDLFYHLAKHQQGQIGGHHRGLPEEQARVILSEVVIALQHLHKHGYIHRDVKVENVMLDARGHVKLVDFGLACRLSNKLEKPMSKVGSLIYMAPELISESVGGRATDWWAVGILAFEIMTGGSPWSNLADRKGLQVEIANRDIAPPPTLSAEAGHFISSLLRRDRVHRLGWLDDGELNGVPFFRGVDWDATAAQENVPCFAPEDSCSFEEERKGSLSVYSTKRSEDGGESAGWSLGLDLVRELPRETMDFQGATAITKGICSA